MSANQSERPAKGRIAEIADEKRRWEKVTKKKSVQRSHGDCYTLGYQGQIHNMVFTTEPHQMKTKLGVVFVVRLKSLSPRRKIFFFCQRVETAFVLNSSPSIIPPQKLFAPFDVLLHEQLSSLLPFVSRKFTKVAKQRQQVSGVAEPQRRQAEGHLGRVECHGEVLDKLSRQALLQQRHVGGHVVRQEDEHADITVHLDLSDLDKSRASRLRTDWCACGSAIMPWKYSLCSSDQSLSPSSQGSCPVASWEW